MSMLRAKDKWIARPNYTSHAMVSEVLVPLIFVIDVQQATGSPEMRPGEPCAGSGEPDP